MKKKVQRAALLKVLPFFIAAGAAQAAGCNHVIDGAFTSSGEWVTCATSKEILFPPVNGVGGAVLGSALSIILDFRIPVFFCSSRQAACHFVQAYLLGAHKRWSV